MEKRECSHEIHFVYRANSRQATFGSHNIDFLLTRKTIANQILTHAWRNKIDTTFGCRRGKSGSFGEIFRCQKNTSQGLREACPSMARSRPGRSGKLAWEGGREAFARAQAGKAAVQQP